MLDALRSPLSDVSAGARWRRGVVLLGLLATLLFTQLLSQQSVAADDDYLLIEARIVAERQADGSVTVWLEARRSDDGWDEWVSPRDRVLPADAELDLWHDTGSFTVAGVTGLLRLSLRHIAHGHVELGLQRGIGPGDDEEESWAERLLPRLRQLDSPRYGPRMFTTTSIDLVDEGPPLCRPGAIVRSGERCRFRDTRSEFVVDADGSASYPVGPQPTAGGSTGATAGVPPNQFRTHFSVPLTDGVAPRSSLEAVIVERLEHGAYLFIRMGYDPLQPANGADCVEALLVPFGHYCGLPTTTGGNVWFVAYPGGLAHVSVPNFDLSWVGEDELHAETTPIDYLPHYRVDAVREAGGWRLTKLIAPQPVESASLSSELEDCAPGQILQPGESCGDPTSTGVYGIAAEGGWVVDDAPPQYQALGTSTINHPNAHGLSFHPLASGSWLVARITGHPENPAHIGLCTIGLVVYPGEVCSQTGGMWFRVFANGLAFSVNTTSFERVNIVGHTVRYGSGSVAQYDFTAERQRDGGFLITWMRERWPVLESRVQRQRGDCFPGLILGSGHGCRYPNAGDMLIVDEDDQLSFTGRAPNTSGAFRFTPWGGTIGQRIQALPLNDEGHIVFIVGADEPSLIGQCAVDLAVRPGESCRTESEPLRFYVFYDSAFFDGVAAHNDLEVDGDDGAVRLRAERQPDRSYVIRELN